MGICLKPVAAGPVDRGRFDHYPRSAADATASQSASEIERLLENWFECPVVLLSSGRAGIRLILRALGFRRNQHNVQVPRFLSRCVINAITTHAFPVQGSSGADATLLYHQFGFPQRWRPSGTVLEDIAHAFFNGPSGGKRVWVGVAAVFSLKKFFPISGLGGGLIIPDAKLESRVRELLASTPHDDAERRQWANSVVESAYGVSASAGTAGLLETVYEYFLQFVRPDETALAGMPQSIEELRTIGELRLARINFCRSLLKDRGMPSGFWEPEEVLVPFALPYFGNGDLVQLERADQVLRQYGVEAGVIHLDVARDQLHPEYKPCLLLPCHQQMPLDLCEEACRIVAACCPI
jgi:hypothetical protein